MNIFFNCFNLFPCSSKWSLWNSYREQISTSYSSEKCKINKMHLYIGRHPATHSHKRKISHACFNHRNSPTLHIMHEQPQAQMHQIYKSTRPCLKTFVQIQNAWTLYVQAISLFLSLTFPFQLTVHQMYCYYPSTSKVCQLKWKFLDAR